MTPSDCFCSCGKPNATIDVAVMRFIKDAVDAAIDAAVEKQKADQQTRDLCQRLIDSGVTPEMAVAVMKGLESR